MATGSPPKRPYDQTGAWKKATLPARAWLYTRGIAAYRRQAQVQIADALQRSIDSNSRDLYTGMLTAVGDARRVPAARREMGWARDRPEPFQQGYRAGTLWIAGLAAVIASDLDPAPSAAAVSYAPMPYVGALPAGVLPHNDLIPLIEAHCFGCDAVSRRATAEAGDRDLWDVPAEAELIWFRFLAMEAGLLPLPGRTSHPLWVRLTLNLSDIPDWARDRLLRRRAERGWDYVAPARRRAGRLRRS